MTLQARLSLLAAGTLAVALAIAAPLVYVVERGALYGQLDSTLRAHARAVESDPGIRGALAKIVVSKAHPARLPATVAALSNVGIAGVVTASGSVGSLSTAPTRLPATRSAQAVAAGTRGASFNDFVSGGTRLRVYAIPVGRGLAVELGEPETNVISTLSTLRWLMVATGLGTLLVAGSVTALLVRRSLRPVAQLTDTAESVIATKDLSRRIDVSGSDEVARLAATFNAMLAALEEALAAQRRLVADASHELKTPLTSLKANLELLGERDGLNAFEAPQLLREALTETGSLNLLVADLLDLARDGDQPVAIEDVRLDLIAQQAIDRARRGSPDHTFETDLPPALVRGDADRLERAILNLLDNAIKWGPEQSPIEVSIRGATLEIRDFGPGIADADLPFIFDRFYRAPAARGLPGSGLGLAIVRQTAELHGGTISVARMDPGTRFVFQLPLPDAPDRSEFAAHS